MGLADLYGTKPRGVLPFLIAFLFVVAAWSGSLVSNQLDVDKEGTILTEGVKRERHRAIELNECRVVERETFKVDCSGLFDSEDALLSEFLRAPPPGVATYENDLKVMAEVYSGGYIYDRDFFVEQGSEALDMHVFYASVAFTAFCMGVSVVVLFVCLPTFLRSNDDDKAKRAGGIVKSALGFLIACGTTLIGGFVLSGGPLW